jgi:hypothetical protein
MQRNMSIVTSLLAVVAATSGALGCSSTSGSSGGSSGSGSSNVSFKADVMPILQQGCTISSVCHGQMGNSGEENLYLGEHQTSLDGTPVDPTVASMVQSMIVGAKSLEDPKLNIVTAGDPANSYLIHKLNGDQDMLEADCAMGMCNSSSCAAPMTCGVQMPMSGSALMASDIQTISNWIMQGALNN